MSNKSSGIHIIFPSIMVGLTLLIIGLGWWTWRDTQHDIYNELTNAGNLLERYYSITFNQRELSLLSLGQRLSEIQGINQAEERLRIANQALELYDDLSAIGFADTTGQILTLTGYASNDLLPNLSQGDATSRTFKQAKESEGLVIGEVYYFDRVNDWIIPIRVPIRNQKGELVAVNTSAMIYERMVQNLKSFGLPEYINVHLINNSYGTTQLYYPLDRNKYYSILQKSEGILTSYEAYKADNRENAFTAISNLSQERMLGVQSKPTKFNHFVEVTAPASLIEIRFWALFKYLFGAYLSALLVVFLAYWYFSRTEEKYTQELQSERDYSNQIISSTPSLIIGLNKHQQCTFANPTAERLLGFGRHTLEGKLWWNSVLNKNENESTRKKYFELTKQGLSDEMIICYNRYHAPLRISWNSVNLYDKDGEIEEIFLFGNDQTEKEVANEKLKEREANLFTLIESTQSIIGLFDIDKRLVEYNQSFENYAKTTENISLRSGLKVVEKMAEPYRTIFNGYLDRSLNGEKIKETVEYKGKGFDFYFLFNYHPIFQEDEIVGVSMFVEDITELKASQEQLKKYSEDLEGLVEERTQELKSTNAKMRSANKELKRTLAELREAQNQLIQNEKMASLGILSAGIGHEINNPLNFIKNGAHGLAKLLDEEQIKDQETIDSFIKIIEEGVSRASTIVKSLSHFSRSGDNMKELCNLEEIVDNSLTILQNKLKHKVTVKKHMKHDQLVILGNSGKLHQAVLNLLTNAEQSIKNTGVIDITSEIENEQILLKVSDTGSGIPDNILGKISDPFFTTKDPGEGTGLGLAITYSIIKEHKGHITVSSEINKGTTFAVYLPLNRAT